MKQLTLLITFCLFSTVSWAVCVEGDCLHGRGTYTWPSGAKHVGNWKDGIRNGQGTYTWLGAKYVGQWKDDKYNGQGTHTWPSGQEYVGQFKNGIRNGQGTMTFEDGREYVGNWSGGVMTGQGTHTWPSGHKYVGQWSKNVRTGEGTHTWPSGEKYVGQWSNGVRTGQGTMTYADGRKYVGQWKDGAPERDFAKEERLGKAVEAERLGKVVEAERLRKAAEAERSRKAAEEERLRKAAEAERLRKAAEAERDSESKSLLIILLAGIAAVFLVIKILRPSKDTEGAGVAPHIEPKQLATAPLGNARIKKSLEENPLRQDLNLKPLQPSARPPGTRFIGGTGGYTIKIVLSLIFFIFLWAPFLSPIFTDAIGYSDYFLYGGEGKAFLAAVLQSVIWIAGMAPLLWFWNKKRTTSRDE